ncbi:MAG: lysophospholipid acyltransferase family protein [Thermoanaerobaculia bacterium]
MNPAAGPARPRVRAWSDPLRWLMLPWTLCVTYPLILLSTTLFGTLAVTLSLISKHLGFYAGVFWARSLTWGTWVRVRVAGREHLQPNQSYVILSNHQGAYDVLALYGFLGREFRWVMKEELRKVPFLGWGCAAIGHIFVDRRNSARAIASLEAAKSHLVGGVSVLLFPEGTRSDDGRLLPFKKGGFNIARQLDLPILPVSITGSNEILPKACFFPRPGTVRVRFHPAIAPGDFPDNNQLIARTRAAIESGLEQDER